MFNENMKNFKIKPGKGVSGVTGPLKPGQVPGDAPLLNAHLFGNREPSKKVQLQNAAKLIEQVSKKLKDLMEDDFVWKEIIIHHLHTLGFLITKLYRTDDEYHEVLKNHFRVQYKQLFENTKVNEKELEEAIEAYLIGTTGEFIAYAQENLKYKKSPMFAEEKIFKHLEEAKKLLGVEMTLVGDKEK